jgi:peroxiredoxin
MLWFLVSCRCTNPNSTKGSGRSSGDGGGTSTTSGTSTGSNSSSSPSSSGGTKSNSGKAGSSTTNSAVDTANIIANMPKYPFTVEGTIIGGGGYNIVLDKIQIGKMEPEQDQDLNNEGRFRMEGYVTEPELYQLRLPSHVMQFIVRPYDRLNFTADFNDPESFQVKGSMEPILLRQMFEILEKKNDKIDDIEEIKNHIKDNAQLVKLLDTLPHYYKVIERQKAKDLKKFISKHDTSFTTLLAANWMDAEDNADYLAQIDKKWANKYPYSPFYISLHEKVVAYEPLLTGKFAPELLATDIEGKQVRLSNIKKGKLLMLYFWNTKDDESIRGLAILRRLYSKYHSRGFEILGIALDDDRAEWLAALNELKLPWQNVNDPGRLKSASAQTYLLSSTPTNFVLDKDGRIVAKRLFENEMDRTINSLLK